MDSISDEQPVPYAKIVNQPSSEYDMRYEKEDRKNKIYAENNTSKSKSQYPKVKIVNGEGPATLIVSCVNKTEPYHVHPHKLVGPNCKHGVAVFNIDKNQNTFHLTDVSIQFTKKDNIEKGIQELNLKNVDPFIAGFDFDRQSIDLQQVRLCFQIFLRDSFDTTEIIRDKYHILKPVVSQVISNSSCKNTLSIKKTINLSSSCNGGSDVVIFIKKLEKNQKPLKVKFYDSSGWSSIVDIEDSEIHYQCAFSFKTPKFPKKIDKEETVFFKLFIPANTAEERNIESEEIKFVYTPSESETMPLNSADVSNQSTNNLFHVSMLNQNSNNYLNDSQTQSQISSHEESLPTLPAKRTFTDNNCAESEKKTTNNSDYYNLDKETINNLINGLTFNSNDLLDDLSTHNHMLNQKEAEYPSTRKRTLSEIKNQDQIETRRKKLQTKNQTISVNNELQHCSKINGYQFYYSDQSIFQNNETTLHNDMVENQKISVNNELQHCSNIKSYQFNISNHPNFHNNETTLHNDMGENQKVSVNNELQHFSNINGYQFNNSNHVKDITFNISTILSEFGEIQTISVNNELQHCSNINGYQFNISNHNNFQNNGTTLHNNIGENQTISAINELQHF